MSEKKKICPECAGKKVVPGTCVCDSEWRGTKVIDGFEDCQCTPDIECPLCHGSGYVSTDTAGEETK